MGTYFDFGYMIKSFPLLLSYVHITLGLTAAAAAGGLALGALLALAILKKIPVLVQLARIYISFMRGTPFLVQLFLFYFGLPELLIQLGFTAAHSVPGIIYVSLVFVLHMGGYGAELMRTAILAVPAGQREAALACGLSEWQSYRQVIFPQAIKIAADPLVNTIVSTLKDTSLVFNVGIIDMMRKADLLGANSQRNLELYIDTAIIYILLVLALHYGGKAVIRFLSRKREKAEVQEVEYC